MRTAIQTPELPIPAAGISTLPKTVGGTWDFRWGKYATRDLINDMPTSQCVVMIADLLAGTKVWAPDVSLTAFGRISILREWIILDWEHNDGVKLNRIAKQMFCMQQTIPNGSEWARSLSVLEQSYDKTEYHLIQLAKAIDFLMLQNHELMPSVRQYSPATSDPGRLRSRMGIWEMRWTHFETTQLFDGIKRYGEIVMLADLLSGTKSYTRSISSYVMCKMVKVRGLSSDKSYSRLIRLRGKMYDAYAKPPSGSELHLLVEEYSRQHGGDGVTESSPLAG